MITIANRHYTIGMAGHIDHGKTTLTKALTNVDTDRLKEEKERNISIELGYAPLALVAGVEASIIDVPGHERFIRQMIAGVAGIDLVLLVIAADEGVMPQTKEHLEILSLLGIERGLIVITKKDKVDEEFLELVLETIKEEVVGTFLEDCELLAVNSVSGEGIDQLKQIITTTLEHLPMRDAKGAFRLPIDQVFTVHGQGTVVRGTVYEGAISEGDILEILPTLHKVRARQIQVHHQMQKQAKAGQRAAINIGGIVKEQVKRGDVLVSSNFYTSSEVLDVHLQVRAKLNHEFKQRSFVKVYVGTAEVYGKLVFFDRNKIEGGETIVCQLRLNEPIVTKRGDRFIIRRPSPFETIGGGVVIDSTGGRYRFGEKTVEMLERKLSGNPSDRVTEALKEEKLLTSSQLAHETGLDKSELDEIITELLANQVVLLVEKDLFALQSMCENLIEDFQRELKLFHLNNPMKEGKQKAEIIQMYAAHYPNKLLDFILDMAIEDHVIKKNGPYLALATFIAAPPEKWKKRVESVCENLKSGGISTEPIIDLFRKNQLPQELDNDLIHFLMRSEVIIPLDDKIYIHQDVLNDVIQQLRSNTDEVFDLKEAKEILGVSRKYLVPLLELLDKRKMTERMDNVRKWRQM